MALPLIGLYVLTALIGFLFLIGVSRYNVNSSLGFIVLASVLMMVTSMFIVNEGIQLNSLDNINPSTLEYNYEVATYEVNTWNWVKVFTDVLFWGSFVGVIFGFAYNFQRGKSRQSNEWAV